MDSMLDIPYMTYPIKYGFIRSSKFIYEIKFNLKYKLIYLIRYVFTIVLHPKNMELSINIKSKIKKQYIKRSRTLIHEV